jgi:hypothetical protein
MELLKKFLQNEPSALIQNYKLYREYPNITIWITNDGKKILKIRKVMKINEYEMNLLNKTKIPYIIPLSKIVSFKYNNTTILCEECENINAQNMYEWLKSCNNLCAIKAIIFKVMCFICVLETKFNYKINNLSIKNILIGQDVTETISIEDKFYVKKNPSIKIINLNKVNIYGDIRTDAITFFNELIARLVECKLVFAFDVMRFALKFYPYKMRLYIQQRLQNSTFEPFCDEEWMSFYTPISKNKTKVKYDLDNNSPGFCFFSKQILYDEFFCGVVDIDRIITDICSSD